MRQRTMKLSEGQRNELIDHRNHDPRPDVRDRCAAVLKVADGHSPHAVALGGLLRPRDPDTVYGWLDRFEEHGIDGLMNGRQGGSRRRPFQGTRGGVGTASWGPPRRGAPKVGADARRSTAQSLDAEDDSSHYRDCAELHSERCLEMVAAARGSGIAREPRAAF